MTYVPKLPYQDKVITEDNKISDSWARFFRKVQDAMNYLGDESEIALSNNVTSQNTGLFFDYRYVSSVFIDILVQRVTNSGELIESGTVRMDYKPYSNSWQITSPFATAATFTNSGGSLLYTTSNQSGTIRLSRMVYRVRPIKAKAYYSLPGNV